MADTVNSAARPAGDLQGQRRTVSLPGFYDTVKTLEQVVEVDY